MRIYDITKIKELVEQGYLMVQRHPTADLSIYNYSAKTQYESFWNEYTLACRGLILDSKGVAHSATFDKFFNHGQKEAVIPENEGFWAYEKKDGSYLGTYWLDGKMYLNTKGSFDFSYVQMATYILDTRYPGVRELMSPEYTYIFELIFPAGRIVCDYGDEEDITLLAVFNIATGEEVDLENFTHLPFSRPDATFYPAGTDLSSLVKNNLPNREGYVFKFVPSGIRVKGKFEDYIYQHRIITNVSSYDIYEAIRHLGGVPEHILERVPDEFYDWVKNMEATLYARYREKVGEAFATFDHIVSQLPKYHTRPEFIALVKPYPTELRSLVLHILDLDFHSLRKYAWMKLQPEYEKPFQFAATQLKSVMARVTEASNKNVRETEGLENPTVEEGRGVRTRESGENPGV